MQFVKGQSGNLKGRPKTTDRSLSEAVLKHISSFKKQ